MARIPTYVNAPVRWSLALISSAIAAANIWLWMDAPFRYKDLESPNEIRMQQLTSAWISLSGLGAIGVYLILHHDQKTLAPYLLLERKRQAFQFFTDEREANRQYSEFAQNIKYVDVEPEPEQQAYQLPERQAEPVKAETKPEPERELEEVEVGIGRQEIARNSEPSRGDDRDDGDREKPSSKSKPESGDKDDPDLNQSVVRNSEVAEKPETESKQKYEPPDLDFEDDIEEEPEEYSLLSDPDYSQLVRIVRDLRCHVIMAVPGTGKTTMLNAFLWLLHEMFPGAEVDIITLKNDSFLGLEKLGKVTVVDDGEDIVEAFAKYNDLVEYRRKLKKPERKKVNRRVLFCTDYYQMMSLLDKDQKAEVQGYNGNISTVGRELKVSTVVDTHELNVRDLGLTGKDIRNVLNIHVLGFISCNERGETEGGYAALDSVMDRDGVGSKSEKANLITQIAKWKKRSEKEGRPIVFSTTGITPTLNLLPNLKWLEGKELPMVSDRLAKQNNKPKSAIAQSINLEKDELEDPGFEGLSSWSSRLLVELLKCSGSKFNLKDLIESNPIKGCQIDWDDSISEEQRTDTFALYLALRECRHHKYLDFNEKTGEVELI